MVPFRSSLRYELWERRYPMKQIEEKFKRKMKYWRVSYQQASGRDRLSMGLFSLLMLAYTWWVFLVF